MHSLFIPDRLEHVRLGTLLNAKKVGFILSLFHGFADVFAWSYANKPGVLPEHRLSVRDSFKPIR